MIKKILGISLTMNYCLIFDREKGIKKLRDEVYFILSEHDAYRDSSFFAVKCAEMTLLRAKIRCFKINPKLQ